MSWSSDPVVITVAPTGAEVTRDDNPKVPYTPAEIADEVARAAGEGASVVHIHARTDDGRPTTEPDVLRTIRDLIRERCEIVIGMSTGAEVGMSHEERLRVLDAGPEIASLNTGSMNFGDEIFDNPPALIEALAKRMAADGIRPELEVYDVGMLGTAARLLDDGVIADPPLYNFVLGVPGICGEPAGAPGQPPPARALDRHRRGPAPAPADHAGLRTGRPYAGGVRGQRLLLERRTGGVQRATGGPGPPHRRGTGPAGGLAR
jgi:uncharacterized protein (DUF849 family)